MSEESSEKLKRGDEFLEKPATRYTGAIVLIVLGVVFLLSQNGIMVLSGNWWAIFIALPAVVMLYHAYTAYNREGRVTSEVRKNLSGGAIVGTVAIIAATDQWDKWWPLFLIVPGVLILLGFMRQGD